MLLLLLMLVLLVVLLELLLGAGMDVIAGRDLSPGRKDHGNVARWGRRDLDSHTTIKQPQKQRKKQTRARGPPFRSEGQRDKNTQTTTTNTQN